MKRLKGCVCWPCAMQGSRFFSRDNPSAEAKQRWVAIMKDGYTGLLSLAFQILEALLFRF